MGAARESAANDSTCTRTFQLSIDHELTDMLRHFWENEESTATHRLTPEQEQCYAHFHRTVRRNNAGRFEVCLPFLETPSLVGTREIAEACLLRMEQRFNKQPQLRRAYCQFMAEYQNLGHLESVPADEIDHSNANYLSHHPVIKDPESESVRVVFNGKQKD